MHAHIITFFPSLHPGTLAVSIPGKALQNKIWSFSTYDIYNYALDKQKTIDDKPYGGGHGLILKPDVLSNAIEDIKLKCISDPLIILPSARGELFKQSHAKQFSKLTDIIFIASRFEGVDQRVIDYYNIQELSLGDFVIFAGDAAIQIILEATIRMIPGIMENPETIIEESFGEGAFENLLEYPQYTRPEIWKEIAVPSILTSGHHKNIENWRIEQATKLTLLKRPNLKN